MSNPTKAPPLTSLQLPQAVQLQPKPLTGHSRIPTSAFTPVNNLPQEIKSEAKAKDPIIVTGLNDKVKELVPDTHLRRPATAERAPFAISRSQSLSHTTTTTTTTTTTSTTSMAHTQRHHHQQRQHMPSSPDTSAILSPSPTPMTTPIPTPTPTPTPEMVSPPHDGVIHDSKKRQTLQQQRPLAKLKATNATPPTTAHVASTHPPPALTAKKHSNCKTIEADCTIIHNPIKKDILKINEENYYLKLEVIRLVSTLKGLKEVSTSVSSSTSPAPSPVPSPAQSNQNPTQKLKSKTKSTSSKPRETVPQTTITPTPTPTITPATTTTKPVGTSVSITKKVSGTAKTAVNVPEPTFRTNCKATATATSNATPNSTHIPTTQPTRKRCHDDDINDLIVSLVDLSHSQVGTPVAEEHTTLSAAPDTATAPAATASRNTTTADRTTKLKSDPYLDTAPVSDADDFDLDLDLDLNVDVDVDADDILSTVSTTPSTMFSLSLSGTNDTIDIVSSGSTGTNIWKTMEDIEEIPPFELLELPNEKSIQSGRMDVRMNYDTGISTTKGKFQMLDTFSVITAMEERDHDDHDQEQDEEEVGSLRLMRFDNGPPEVPDLDLNFNFNFNDAMDVDHEFANFVDGKGF
jgi:hypothetical protein